MIRYTCIYIVIPLVLSVIIINFMRPKSVLSLSDLTSCPYCYGENLCEDIKHDLISLRYETISDLIYNVLSVKNVYFARYNGKSVVLKKLAHNQELTRAINCTFVVNTLIEPLGEEKQYKLCDKRSAELLLNHFNATNFKNLCTILSINIEPLILQLFDNNWFLPKYYGSCGRIIVEGYSGVNLNSMENYDWLDRAYVACQILLAAKQLSENHNLFRMYLTDLSPDNIAIDKDLTVHFVDLENVILKAKGLEAGKVHHSKDFRDDFYAFSEDDICDAEISDHNIYSVCKLLLSESAPRPMMKGGLLHNPPEGIKNDLFKNIAACVDSEENLDRFDVADKILVNLRVVLKRQNFPIK